MAQSQTTEEIQEQTSRLNTINLLVATAITVHNTNYAAVVITATTVFNNFQTVEFRETSSNLKTFKMDFFCELLKIQSGC